MERIKLFTDSGSDICREDAEKYDIEVIPLSLVMKDRFMTDYIDFDNEKYAQFLRTLPEIPTTSQPSPEAFFLKYEQFSQDYDHILCITMSVHGSGTYNSAMIAKGMFEEKHHGHPCKIHVLDSWSCSLSEVIELKLAHQLIEKGTPIEDILFELDKVRRKVLTTYLVDNIEYLIKGGRVSVLKGSIASKLKLKPIIGIRNGAGVNLANALGYQNGIVKMAGYYTDDVDENGELYVAHVGCPEKAMALVNKIKETYPNLKYHIHPMLGTMSTQGGPDTISMCYIRNR